MIAAHTHTGPRVVFKAHLHAGGFGIRFTVQFNLFAGSIIALGGPEHVALLDKYQNDGTLGCFALTEVSAGVNSGLIVETTAEWHDDRSQFLLNSRTKGVSLFVPDFFSLS